MHPQTVAYHERWGGKLGRRCVKAIVGSLMNEGVSFFHGECVGSRLPSPTRVVVAPNSD